MEDYVWPLVAMAAVILFSVLWTIFQRIDRLMKSYDHLYKRIDECAKNWEIELLDRTKQLHNEKLEALEVHLGIRFVETPKRLVVKNILEK